VSSPLETPRESAAAGAGPAPSPGTARSFSPRRFVSGALALLAGTLAGISSITAWWTETYVSGGSLAVVHFLPGGSLTGFSDGMSITAPYSLIGVGDVGDLYETILVLALVVLVLCLASGILGVIGSLVGGRAPNRDRLIRILLVSALGLALLSVVLAPAVQPYGLSHASSGGCSGFGSQSPCKFFWGNGSSGATAYAWGGDVGYYLMVVVDVFVVVALLFSVRPAKGSGGPLLPAQLAVPPAAPATPPPAPVPPSP